ncbi:MAG: hypothetical protein RXR18_03185 [Nitrososphaeria archaeon]
MLSLKENLLTGKLQVCKAYQPEGYSSFTANTKVQGLFMFRKRLEGINSLCLSKLNVKPKLYEMYRANVSYIGKIFRTKGYSIDNNMINQVLKEAGFAMSEPKKWHRKKWIKRTF